MPRKNKTIHISDMPSGFKGTVTKDGRFIKSGIPPLGGVYDKVAKTTGLIRLGNEFLYNGINNLIPRNDREQLMDNTAGRLVDYVKNFNKESFPNDEDLGPTFSFNIIQTPRTNGRNMPQKQYAVGGKIPNVVAGGIAQPLGNNFFYMNGRKHSQGGIDIGPSDKTGIEVEGGEVVETNGNELKVYSAQPILNGASPAQLVMGGANPNKVFKAQEDFKDRNDINDDGTKAKYGKEKYVVKSDNTRVTPIMESPRNSGIKQGDFIYHPETYRIVNNTLEKVPARKEVNMTPLEQVNPEFDILTSIRSIANLPRGFFNTKAVNDVPGNYYRQGKGIIADAKKSGVVKVNSNAAKGVTINTGNKTINLRKTFDVPFWSKNYRWFGNNNYETIVSKGDNGLTWQPISKSGHFRTAEQEAIRRTPLYNGQTNNTPAELFEYYRKYPIIGYGNVTNGEAFMPITGLNTSYNIMNKKKLGGKNMIVSISGNVKNGLLHSPSSTGGRHDKLIDGGRRTNPDSLKADRLWSDRQINKIRYLTDLRNSTRNIVVPTGYKVTDIHRTNEPGRYSLAVNIPNQDSINVNIPLRNLPASNIPKGEEYIEKLIEADRKLNLKSDRNNYTRGYDGRVYFKSWINGKSGEINYGTNEFYNQTRSGKNALENARPQYYAERELPLFDDGPAITSGLVRAGWSHGNNKNITVDNTNIPNLPATKSKGNTPRRGRNKSSQSVQSSSTKTPPTATYNRNLPTIEASIPTTLPVSTSAPAKQSSQSDGKGQGKFKNITTADWIGLSSNIAGGLASYFASKRAINKMRGPGKPTLVSANKLKTKYNINPQLDRIREDKFEAYRDIDSNTASSRVGLARKQRVRNATGQAVNQLYGEKENIETNLINQNRRNQQSVRQFNAQQYNQYIDRKTAFDNGIREAKLTNVNNLFTGINAGIQDMISRYENRKALNNTIGAMRASAPNVDDRIMRDAGVDYDEFVIRKRRKLGGK